MTYSVTVFLSKTVYVVISDMDVENLTTVLEDLKSLTDAVLKDDSDTASDTDV